MPRLLIAAAALRATLPTLTAQAQRYPTKPIRLVVPFPPAGIAEILARIIGQKMTESLGQQMVIEPTTPEELQKAHPHRHPALGQGRADFGCDTELRDIPC